MENPLANSGELKAPETPAAPPAKSLPTLANLRTFKDDIAEAVQGANLSTAKIFLAEEERRRERERREVAASPEAPQNRFLLSAAVVLVVLGLAGFAYFRFLYRVAAPQVTHVDVPIFIRSDKVVEIAAADRSYRDVQADLRRVASTPVPDREVHQVALSEAREVTPENSATSKQIESGTLFRAIGAYPPDELLRALAPDFFIGVYGSSKGPMPFLILEAQNVKLARAAMLAWEPTMAADLAPLFPKADSYARVSANQPSRLLPWGDAVYGNRDARVLETADTEILLWGVGDGGDIIVAQDPFILSEMASRLTRDRELH